MLAATLKPDAFAAIGAWEPPMPWVDWWPDVVKRVNLEIAASRDPAAVLESMYRRLLGDDTWDALSPDARARRRADAVAFQVDMASELSAPFVVDDVVVPMLIGYGTATADAHIRGAQWLAEQLPDARLHCVDGAGHFAHRTHPAEFAEFVRATVALAAT
jgi:pimeloyl-ACP methyl ester carboxylesterase